MPRSQAMSPNTADVRSEASALLIASLTQYVGTKCATVCTAEPIIESGIQAPPKNVMSKPSRLPTPLSSSSRAPRLERAKPTASGVHARANVAASARHTRPTPTSATAPAKPTTPIMLDTSQIQTVSTAAAANTASERWRSGIGPASIRRTRSGSFMPENTSPTDTMTDEMIAYAPKLKYVSSVAAAVESTLTRSISTSARLAAACSAALATLPLEATGSRAAEAPASEIHREASADESAAAMVPEP